MQSVILYWHRVDSSKPVTVWVVTTGGQYLTKMSADQPETLTGLVGAPLYLSGYAPLKVAAVICRDYGDFLEWRERQAQQRLDAAFAGRSKAVTEPQAGHKYEAVRLETGGCVYVDITDKLNNERAQAARDLKALQDRCTAAEQNDNEQARTIANLRKDLAAAKALLDLDLRIKPLQRLDRAEDRVSVLEAQAATDAAAIADRDKEIERLRVDLQSMNRLNHDEHVRVRKLEATLRWLKTEIESRGL